MKFPNKILALILLLMLSNCKWFTGAGTPYFSGLNFKVPQGSPAFQQGYKDGCSTILYARGNGLYRDRYGYRYDPKMMGNPEYRFGHARGQSYCFQSIIGPIPQTSADRYLSPFGYDPTYSAKPISSTWGGGMAGDVAAFDTFKGSAGGGLDEVMGIWGAGSGGVLGGRVLWEGGSSGQIFGQ